MKPCRIKRLKAPPCGEELVFEANREAQNRYELTVLGYPQAPQVQQYGV